MESGFPRRAAHGAGAPPLFLPCRFAAPPGHTAFGGAVLVCARRHRRLLRRSLRKARGHARRAAPAKAGGTSRSLPPRRARRGANHNHVPVGFFYNKKPPAKALAGGFSVLCALCFGAHFALGLCGPGHVAGPPPCVPGRAGLRRKVQARRRKKPGARNGCAAPRARRSAFQKMRKSHHIRQVCGICAARFIPRFRLYLPGGQITPPALRPLPLRARRTRRRAGPALPGAAPPRAGRCPPG